MKNGTFTMATVVRHFEITHLEFLSPLIFILRTISDDLRVIGHESFLRNVDFLNFPH